MVFTSQPTIPHTSLEEEMSIWSKKINDTPATNKKKSKGKKRSEK